MKKATIGQRVEAGDIPTDYDTGRVIAVEGNQATVAWDSGVTTTADVGSLRPEGRRPVA